MIATNKHQQPILLEPDRAEMLQKLSERTRIPKQALLREAVDLLLSIQGHKHVSPQLDAWRESLMMCELVLSKARHIELPEEADRACAESVVRIHEILEAWGAPKETRLSYDRNPPTGANSHKAKRAKTAKQ